MSYAIENEFGNLVPVELGQDVSNLLGITKYVPPIPVHMAGEVANMFGYTISYDFERLESVPTMFEHDEPIIATEKLHGTFCAIIWHPGLNHPEMFGSNGDIVVHSKGLGAQGLAFKNNDANNGNIYVKTLRKLLDLGLEDSFKSIDIKADRYAILGEIYGKGVQDLHYGTSEPQFRMFDMIVGDHYHPQDEMGFHYAFVPIVNSVPVLYKGPFDSSVLEKYRDGKTMLGEGNIREGIVVKGDSPGLVHMKDRKIAKMISPNYLLRKSTEATEYN